jgi:hypothetical protein
VQAVSKRGVEVMTDSSQPVIRTTDEHNATTQSAADGPQATCSCGWRGRVHDRMSEDYAWSNAKEDAAAHVRYALKVSVVDLREEVE